MAVGGPPIVDLLVPAGEHAKGKATRPLSESKIPRDGLSAGTEAPRFRASAHRRRHGLPFGLPRPERGPRSSRPAVRSLSRASRRRFERFHKENPNFDVLLISRGDPAANRQKVKEHRLTMPVALQKRWEISKKYAMFATPIAYLVDERGIIARGFGHGAGRNPRDGFACGSGEARRGGDGLITVPQVPVVSWTHVPMTGPLAMT